MVSPTISPLYPPAKHEEKNTIFWAFKTWWQPPVPWFSWIHHEPWFSL
jgi:hypothetical protein